MSKLSQIKNNIWFSNFNWDVLMILKMKAPYIPKLNIIKEDDKHILFNEYAKNLPEPERNNKHLQITSEVQKEYDNWFQFWN